MKSMGRWLRCVDNIALFIFLAALIIATRSLCEPGALRPAIVWLPTLIEGA
jgi:hypothetical protein